MRSGRSLVSISGVRVGSGAVRGLSLGHWLELLQLHGLYQLFSREQGPNGDLAVPKTWSKSGPLPSHTVFLPKREATGTDGRKGGNCDPEIRDGHQELAELK